jgi:saccharopine dehydrogenase-like NADP-dependent oxidoreductase
LNKFKLTNHFNLPILYKKVPLKRGGFMKKDIDVQAGRKDLKIAIFGGGAVGSILISFLHKLEAVSLIYCLDSNAKRAKEFIRDWAKLFLIEIKDNSQEKLIRMLEGCFLVINAATSEINDSVMGIALKTGAHYIDFASLSNDVPEQKSWHESFIRKGITGWINIGVGPGLTNLLAAKLIEGLNDCIVRIWTAEETDSKELTVLWKRELLVDEMLSEIPLVNGFTREPFSAPEAYTFPPPIGKTFCVNINQNERLTLGLNPAVREVYGKSGGADIEKLKSLYPKVIKKQKRKGLTKFIKTLPQTPTPKELQEKMNKGIIRNGWISVAVEVDGLDPNTKEREFRKATWMGLSLKEVPRGTTHINFNTAVVAFCAAFQLINTGTLPNGVWAPDQFPKEIRENILSCVGEKTHQIKYKI